MRNTYPLLGIGMPVYNGAPILGQIIERVLCQSYTNFHLYIFDDCSNDDSLEIAKSYANKDKRIFIHKNKINLGQPGNFNKCIHLLGYRYVSIKSQDDIIYKDYYKKCVYFLEHNFDYVACYTDDIYHNKFLCQYEDDDPYSRVEYIIKNFFLGI